MDVNVKIAVISMAVNVMIEAMAQVKRPSNTAESMVGCCSPLGKGELSESEASNAAAIFGALGDPVRLRMLSLIAAAPEVCSCALEGPLAKSQPTISHHTRILAEAGLIEGEKRGRWMWWHVVPSQLNEVARILSVGVATT